MLRMSTAIANRLFLAGPVRGSHGRDSAAIRRYRLARLRVEGRPRRDPVRVGAARSPIRGSGRPGDARHAHLTRLYD